MATLAEKAEVARSRAAAKATKDAAVRRKKNIAETKPLAAERIAKMVGRKSVPLKSIEVTKTCSGSRGGHGIVFDYDGVEFQYDRDEGLQIRRDCPYGCGATITGSAYDLASLGSFLAKGDVPSYKHACYESAVRALQREAEAYARELNDTPTGLLLRAADTPFQLRRVR